VSCFPADKLDQIPNAGGDVTGARKELAFLGHIAWILVATGFGFTDFSETGVISFLQLYVQEVRDFFKLFPT